MHPIMFRIPLPKAGLPLFWVAIAVAGLLVAYAAWQFATKQRQAALIAAVCGAAVAGVAFGFLKGKTWPLGALPIYSYGVMLGLSLVVGWYLTLGLAEKEGLPKELMANCYVDTAVAAVIGSRILYVLTNLDEFKSPSGDFEFLSIFAMRRGGLVAYGGFLGGFIGSYLYLRYGVGVVAFLTKLLGGERHKTITLRTADLVEGGLGIRVQNITRAIADALKIPVSQGVVVEAIDRDSAAARAGLKRGDVILQVNKQPVKRSGDFADLTSGREHDIELYAHEPKRKWQPLPLLAWADVAVPSLASGLLITRIGCYLFGCDFGKPLCKVEAGACLPGTTWGPAFLQKLGSFPHWPEGTLDHGEGSPAWAQHVHQRGLSHDAATSLPVHPTQIYESLIGAALLVFLLWARKRQTFRGQIFLLFTFSYAVLRFLLEILRDDLERGSIPPSLPEHWLVPACLALLAIGYVIGFSRMIENVPLRRATQVLAFVPPVLLYFALKPAAFGLAEAVELSTSQAVAISTGFAACVGFSVLYRAALAHPESAMALNVPVDDLGPLIAEEDDDDEEDVPRPAKRAVRADAEEGDAPPKKRKKKAKKKKVATDDAESASEPSASAGETESGSDSGDGADEPAPPSSKPPANEGIADES